MGWKNGPMNIIIIKHCEFSSVGFLSSSSSSSIPNTRDIIYIIIMDVMIKNSKCVCVCDVCRHFFSVNRLIFCSGMQMMMMIISMEKKMD